jgi:serine/threonine protein kinase
MVEFKVGSVIAERYVVKSSLGKGGMGMVFLVNDKKTRRDFALKTMLPKFLEHHNAQARFVREVNTLRRLNHPGIMKVYDARKWNDMLFYVMEYVEGKSLRKALQEEGRFPLATVVNILSLVADALEHAHQLTIHRDLSPENIMLVPDGSVRLLDFGLAKLDDKYKDLTSAGANLGRIEYMAPEQQINASKVDVRADIYPLGIMFFELLVGRRPKFNEKITDLCPELPYEAIEFMRKTTDPDPDKRFATVSAFRDELLRVHKIAQGKLPSASAKWKVATFFRKVFNKINIVGYLKNNKSARIF